MLGCLLSTDPFGWLKPGRSEAALLQFPTTDLRNTYYLVSHAACDKIRRRPVTCCESHLDRQRVISPPPVQVRAGEGESEAADIVLTNPVAKTSMSSGLSPLGRQQILRTASNLKAMGACSEVRRFVTC